jgi:low temperature requirement protein LtrA
MLPLFAGFILLLLVITLLWLASSWVFARLGTLIYFIAKPFRENKEDKEE